MSSGHYCDGCAQAYYKCVCNKPQEKVKEQTIKMNERIEKLWTKVCQSEMPELDETCMTLQRRTKFAELIVKETMQVVANQLPSNQYLDVADAVIKHFGVEE